MTRETAWVQYPGCFLWESGVKSERARAAGGESSDSFEDRYSSTNRKGRWKGLLPSDTIHSGENGAGYENSRNKGCSKSNTKQRQQHMHILLSLKNHACIISMPDYPAACFRNTMVREAKPPLFLRHSVILIYRIVARGKEVRVCSKLCSLVSYAVSGL